MSLLQRCYDISLVLKSFPEGHLIGLIMTNTSLGLLREIGTFSGETALNCFASLQKKKVDYKRKELSLHWSQFFPLRVDPFSEGAWCTGRQTESQESCTPCKSSGNDTKAIQSPRETEE